MLAALMLLAGPFLDDAAEAGMQATAVADAQGTARAADQMARWARHHCRNAAAVTLSVEGDAIACLDGQGQRVASIAASKP